MRTLRPRNILIIGGGSGIGYSTAQCMLDNKVDSVVIAGRNFDKLLKAKEKLKFDSDQEVLTYHFDISNISSHLELLEQIKLDLGRFIDGLVISSGVNYGADNWKGFNISEQDYDKVMDINLKGPFFLVRNYANYMYANKQSANICLVSSISAHRDSLSVYQISKNSISGIVHAYGKHLAKRGIILNCVEPGTTDTDMMPYLRPYTDGYRKGKRWYDNGIQRVIRPSEIADIIAYLMSQNCDVLAGSCILAGGGCISIGRGY